MRKRGKEVKSSFSRYFFFLLPFYPLSLLTLPFALCLLTFAFPAAFAQSVELLEAGSGARVETPAASPSEIKIVSYNMRWRSGENLRDIINLLRSDPEIGRAQIIGLQEADRNKKRSGYTNTARLIASELGMYYAWAAPPVSERSKESEEETGVAILSRYPMTETVRLLLPNEGPGGRRRVALGATIRIGAKLIRVYSIHAETRISTEKKLEQLEWVVRDLKNYTKATGFVVLGDFNTLEQQAIENTTQLFTEAGFETPFPNSLKTWKTFVIELKLDWIWLKGLRPSDYGVDREIRYSDHFPLWVKINLDGNSPGKAVDISGRIKKINRADVADGRNTIFGTLLIDGDDGAKPGFDKALVRVNTGTSIAVIRKEVRNPLSFDELRVGDRVQVRFTPGPVLMSYPVQATAAEITVFK
ncbi:MAG TPA: endonuclease/exonuclease/phosphatase family protein [Pyrinomonadaceae bacterium]|jgi:endonuclease/exonuclease/phosphatase family metal-dependent hydrolase